MNKITKNDFTFIHWDKDSGGPESFKLMIYCKSKQDADDKKQQILQNQEKANKCSNEECNGVLKWSARFRKSLQENNQLKEELKSAVTLLDNTSGAGGKLKSKLEKIKKLVKERECDYEEIAFTTFMIKLKKILEEENKND